MDRMSPQQHSAQGRYELMHGKLLEEGEREMPLDTTSYR